MDSKEIQERLEKSGFNEWQIRTIETIIDETGYRKLSPMPELEHEVEDYLNILSDDWDNYILKRIKTPITIRDATAHIMQLFQSKLNAIKDKMKLISEKNALIL